ncbi:hypothetical protein P9239_00310 [Caballeronia sp. LZ062]|uniref:hypothetical protein n=1 Tax=unclassified Caballeronia TaxID=2646786 RepID=UPI00285E1E5F|nr:MULTISPECIES: hypothetical protein [unclassified Caballeronia]MDR5857248.1 hypothetical protein [Caballeronia sp. LZ050]MDR5868799.1 hypothetical protein [Caballeronia sp. LZ062]
MFRVDDATAAPSLPSPEAVGTPGYFTEGNAAAGTPATNVRASWLNMLQEEMMSILAAGGITPSKTTYTQIRDAIKAYVGPGRLLRTLVYFNSGGTQYLSVNGGAATTTGATVYTPSAGLGSAYVQVQGAGGGGGGTAATSTGQYAIGSGGASGSYGSSYLTAAQIGASQAITVGTAGAFGGANGNGGTGGSSSFGSLISAPGGNGGPVGLATSSTSSLQYGAQPGAAATGGNIVSTYGMQGVTGSITGSLFVSGAGGGSPIFGGSGGGKFVSGNGTGQPAGALGAGGGGAAIGPSSAASTGGYGAGGIIIIQEYA